jgi:hypothetical protein
MKHWIEPVGLVAVFFVILAFYVVIVGYGFPAFERATPAEELIEVGSADEGPALSRFLWNHRSIDLIGQAFVLFAAATCCVVMLRSPRKEK